MRRSGESIAYADEGYIELTHVKDVSLTSCCHGGTGAASEVARRFAVSLDLKVVYGSSLAENRAVHFLCPPETGSMWHTALPRLASAIRSVFVSRTQYFRAVSLSTLFCQGRGSQDGLAERSVPLPLLPR